MRVYRCLAVQDCCFDVGEIPGERWSVDLVSGLSRIGASCLRIRLYAFVLDESLICADR